MNSVLADTGPLYALVDPDDQHHVRAHGELEQLVAQGFEVIVLHSTILEAYTLILRKLGVATAQGWLGELVDGVALLNPSPDDYENARERARQYPDQAITLFDATLASLSAGLELPVWAYDFHFDVMRIDVWRGL